MATVARIELSNPPGPGQADVAELVERVADAVDALGDVEVCDLVLHARLLPDGRDRPSIVVYYRAATTPSGRTSAPAPP